MQRKRFTLASWSRYPPTPPVMRSVVVCSHGRRQAVSVVLVYLKFIFARKINGGQRGVYSSSMYGALYAVTGGVILLTAVVVGRYGVPSIQPWKGLQLSVRKPKSPPGTGTCDKTTSIRPSYISYIYLRSALRVSSCIRYFVKRIVFCGATALSC